MENCLRIEGPSDNDVWCVALLLYPTRGLDPKSVNYISGLTEE